MGSPLPFPPRVMPSSPEEAPRSSRLTDTAEATLLVFAQHDRRARRALVRAHLPDVLDVLAKFQGGIPLRQGIDEGTAALVDAVETHARKGGGPQHIKTFRSLVRFEIERRLQRLLLQETGGS